MNGFAQLAEMKRQIRSLNSLRGSVVTAAAPALTAQLKASHANGTDAYGRPFGTNSDGSARTLRKSGRLAASLQVIPGSAGLKAVVGASYGRFWPVLPGVAGLPSKWSAEIQRVAQFEFSVRTGGKR
jgi:hypothetical protein